MESINRIPTKPDLFALPQRPDYREYGFPAAFAAVDLAVGVVNEEKNPQVTEADFQWRLIGRLETRGYFFSRKHLEEALVASIEKASFRQAWNKAKFAIVNSLLWRDSNYRDRNFQKAALDRSFAQVSEEVIRRTDGLIAERDIQVDDDFWGRLSSWLEKY